MNTLRAPAPTATRAWPLACAQVVELLPEHMPPRRARHGEPATGPLAADGTLAQPEARQSALPPTPFGAWDVEEMAAGSAWAAAAMAPDGVGLGPEAAEEAEAEAVRAAELEALLARAAGSETEGMERRLGRMGAALQRLEAQAEEIEAEFGQVSGAATRVEEAQATREVQAGRQLLGVLEQVGRRSALL